jgi:ABC-type multidrug transport system permease subunit
LGYFSFNVAHDLLLLLAFTAVFMTLALRFFKIKE